MVSQGREWLGPWPGPQMSSQGASHRQLGLEGSPVGPTYRRWMAAADMPLSPREAVTAQR